ncbi:MAG: hypothetical protein U0531_08620 [Dehalococcoidia bacterium]
MPASATLPMTVTPTLPQSHHEPDLRAVAGDLVRDLIRRDPELWARVQADPELRRSFGFDDDSAG